MSAAGRHGGGPHRAKLAHVQRQTAGDGDGGDGGVALTLVAHDIFTIFSQYFHNIFTIFSQKFHDIFTI